MPINKTNPVSQHRPPSPLAYQGRMDKTPPAATVAMATLRQANASRTPSPLASPQISPSISPKTSPSSSQKTSPSSSTRTSPSSSPKSYPSEEEYYGGKLQRGSKPEAKGGSAKVYKGICPSSPSPELRKLIAYKLFFQLQQIFSHKGEGVLPLKVKGKNGIVQTYAIVARIGNDPTTDHVLENSEDVIEEMQNLENILNEKIKPLQEMIDAMKKANPSKEIIETIREFESQIEDLKKEHRLNIVASIQEFVKGTSLLEALNAYVVVSQPNTILKGIPVEMARNYTIQLLEAINNLHELGIIHRDIKPENIQLDLDDRGKFINGKWERPYGTIKLLDLGLAKDVGERSDPRMHTCCGSPNYTPPEVLFDVAYNEKADSYSAGLTIFTMIAGAFAFNKPNDAALHMEIINYGSAESSLAQKPETSAQIAAIAKQDPALARVIVELSPGNANDRITPKQALDLLKAGN